MKTITVNGVIYTCPFFDAMPALTDEERSELKADIALTGITYPVVVTDANEVIDGHHRLEIAAELGLTNVPISVKSGLTADQKREQAVNLNLHRRHLNGAQKREIIARRLKADPARSNNAVAGDIRVSDKTVGTVRKALEATSEIPKLTATRGQDGRTRMSKRTPPAQGEAEHPPAPAAVKKPTRPYQWSQELRYASSVVAEIANDLKRLSKLLVTERSPDRIHPVAERLSRILADLERKVSEGGPS